MGKKKNRKNKYLFSVFCRAIGPGGTSVSFKKDLQGNVVVTWENEECPYEDYYEGHNISIISKEKWEEIIKK